MSVRNMKVVGIDPGGNLGVAIMEIDHEFNVVDIEFRTYVIDKYISKHKLNKNNADKLSKLYDIVTDVIEEVEPVAMAMEEAFFNRLFPKSGLLLSEYIGVIKLAVKRANYLTHIFTYPPKYIKHRVGATGKAFKNDMTACLLLKDDIKPLLLKYEGSYTEHSIDAAAITIVLKDNIKKDPMILQRTL